MNYKITKIDDIDKLAIEYDPRKNLDAESLRQAFKKGYSKAEEKCYKDMVDFIKWIGQEWTYVLSDEGWVWEYQDEQNTPEMYKGFKTEEDLLKIYFIK